MHDTKELSRKHFYTQLSKSNISVSEVDEYLWILARLGYIRQQATTKGATIPLVLLDVFLAAQRLYLQGSYTREEALSFAVESLQYDDPNFIIQPQQSSKPTANFIDFLFTYNEKAIIGVCVFLSLIGVLASLSFLLYPQNGFMNTESVLGSVSRLITTP